MRFAMLYSCGKDSALALERMLSAGHEPICLITTYNKDAGRSWFHGVDDDLLDAVSESLGIPLLKCVCTGDTYVSEMERCLNEARELGAEAAAFGDIDIEDHLTWNQERCAATGLTCMVPLWQESREALVHEVLDKGFKTVVKCVDLERLDSELLGEVLAPAVLSQITAAGADICGENGEYHTFVYDGPIFKKPVNIHVGEKLDFGSHGVVDITLDR